MDIHMIINQHNDPFVVAQFIAPLTFKTSICFRLMTTTTTTHDRYIVAPSVFSASSVPSVIQTVQAIQTKNAKIKNRSYRRRINIDN